MAILTSHEIRAHIETGRIEVTPYDEKRVSQNSLDVTLGKGVCVYSGCTHLGEDPEPKNSLEVSQRLAPWDCFLSQLDVKKDNPVRRFEMDDSGWRLQPGILYLMHVVEVLYAPRLVMTLDGRSSYGRLGLTVHVTAGHAETGFHGQYTLEVTVIHPVVVYPGTPIAQVLFHTVEGEIEDYSKRGTYTGAMAMGAQPSRSWRHFQ
jgi:dCTP deaminase